MTTTLLDLDALLDQNLSAVEAAPEFITPDTGNYRFELVKVTSSVRKARDPEAARAEGKPEQWAQINFDYAIIETLSLEEGGLTPKPGSLFRESFNINEQGLPYFKARVQDLIVANGGTEEDADSLSLRDVIGAFGSQQLKFDCHVKTSTVTLDNGNPWTSSRISQVASVE